MGFKSKEELRDIISGGVYNCGVHDFICDIKDTDSIRKHEEDYPHTIAGTGTCQRCKSVQVRFKALPKPKNPTAEPGCFCEDCKKEILAEIQGGSE
jgi:hypothetical protein